MSRRLDGGDSVAEVPALPAPERILSDAVVELADRRSENLEVALFWARRSGRLWVKVTDRQNGHTARIDATAANALDVFRHPYAYERAAA